jgi:hypothetical protein
MNVLEELREMIGADMPVSDAALLVGAAEMLRGLDELVAELRAENAELTTLLRETEQQLRAAPRQSNDLIFASAAFISASTRETSLSSAARSSINTPSRVAAR